MYVSVESCYAREEAVLGATTSKLYYFADEVDVVAKTDTGYYKLKDGTFIHSDYLTTSKPHTTTTAPATENPNRRSQQQQLLQANLLKLLRLRQNQSMLRTVRKSMMKLQHTLMRSGQKRTMTNLKSMVTM